MNLQLVLRLCTWLSWTLQMSNKRYQCTYICKVFYRWWQRTIACTSWWIFCNQPLDSNIARRLALPKRHLDMFAQVPHLYRIGSQNTARFPQCQELFQEYKLECSIEWSLGMDKLAWWHLLLYHQWLFLFYLPLSLRWCLDLQH